MAVGIDARRGLNHPLRHISPILRYTVGRTEVMIGPQVTLFSVCILFVAQGGRGRAAASSYSVLASSPYPIRKWFLLRG